MFYGKPSQSEYSVTAKFCPGPFHAKHYLVVEEHVYDFTSTRIELGGKQIFEALGENFQPHDD